MAAPLTVTTPPCGEQVAARADQSFAVDLLLAWWRELHSVLRVREGTTFTQVLAGDLNRLKWLEELAWLNFHH